MESIIAIINQSQEAKTFKALAVSWSEIETIATRVSAQYHTDNGGIYLKNLIPTIKVISQKTSLAMESIAKQKENIKHRI